MGRTAYDFEEHGPKNIRTYIRNFELPRPDALSEKDWHFVLGRGPYAGAATEVNKSHKNHLESRHEKWRYLENIRHLSLEVISPLKWTNTALPNTPVAQANEATLIPSGLRYKLPSVLPQMFTHAPIQIENMAPWLSLLLITAARILHYTHPRTEPFGFQPGNNKARDKHIFQYFIWACSGNPHEPRWNSGSVLVAYQPPFILTVTDLEEFVSCKAFPSFDSLTTPLQSKYRLWAKIWDACQVSQCNWFILTSYTHWVFGAFSRGMRVAFTSPVIAYNRKQPTILEYVLFWLCSAMELPGAFRLPQVGDEVLHICETSCTAYDILSFGEEAVLALCGVDETVFAELDVDMEPIARMPRPPASESFWSGRDQSPELSAHVDLESALQGEGSLVSCWATPERSQSSTTRGGIKAWLATCRNAQHRALDEDDFVHHNLPEYELLENMFGEDQFLGEWMIPA